jgi:hypothetical protein
MWCKKKSTADISSGPAAVYSPFYSALLVLCAKPQPNIPIVYATLPARALNLAAAARPACTVHHPGMPASLRPSTTRHTLSQPRLQPRRGQPPASAPPGRDPHPFALNNMPPRPQPPSWGTQQPSEEDIRRAIEGQLQLRAVNKGAGQRDHMASLIKGHPGAASCHDQQHRQRPEDLPPAGVRLQPARCGGAASRGAHSGVPRCRGCLLMRTWCFCHV